MSRLRLALLAVWSQAVNLEQGYRAQGREPENVWCQPERQASNMFATAAFEGTVLGLLTVPAALLSSVRSAPHLRYYNAFEVQRGTCVTAWCQQQQQHQWGNLLPPGQPGRRLKEGHTLAPAPAAHPDASPDNIGWHQHPLSVLSIGFSAFSSM
jgi:hypothetical protein